ncbi:MAG: hypothetical protein OXU20_21460 [Myxococcales bacterium]|nr:hypothetical protein [Myxococcales bacterium]MDD9970948.1 hypothetical protein [Myxococcales bacterium]
MGELSGTVSEAVTGVVATDDSCDPALCARCDVRLRASFYRINGRRVCVPCQRRLRGSPLLGVAYGLLAAGVCVAVYYGVLRLFDIRFLLIAIVAGVAIGSAARRGMGYRTRFLNRPLSLLLTYAAVATTYLHSVLELQAGRPVESPMEQPILAAWMDSLTLPFRMAMEGKNLVALTLLVLGLHESWMFSKPPKVHQEGPFDPADA